MQSSVLIIQLPDIITYKFTDCFKITILILGGVNKIDIQMSSWFLPAYRYHCEFHSQSHAILWSHLFVLFCTILPYVQEELVRLLNSIEIALEHALHIEWFYKISMFGVLGKPSAVMLGKCEALVMARNTLTNVSSRFTFPSYLYHWSLTTLKNVFSIIIASNLSSFFDTRLIATAPPNDCPYATSFVCLSVGCCLIYSSTVYSLKSVNTYKIYFLSSKL